MPKRKRDAWDVSGLTPRQRDQWIQAMTLKLHQDCRDHVSAGIVRDCINDYYRDNPDRYKPNA